MLINLIDFIKEKNHELTKNTKELELDEETFVSELQIHKILFIVYGAFHKKFGKELFCPNFEAWKYGPVEIDYRKYVKENNKDCFKKFTGISVNNDEKSYLSKLITKLLKFSAWSLVEYTHSLDAWINNYDKQEKKLNIIPKEDIFETFKDIDFVF